MICKFLKRFCEKREEIKIEKSTVKPEIALGIVPFISMPKWFRIAINEIGIKEYPGENHNPKIIEYHKSCELRAKSDEISWCSAFVNWCFQKSGDERTKSAAAISWRNWGEKTESPQIGDVVLFRRVGSSWRGHVGFFVAEDEKRVLVLGGNQGDSVSFQWYKKHGKLLYLFQYRSIKRL